jgi:2'-5' RNA ligase
VTLPDDAKPERLFMGVPVAPEARAAIVRALPKALPGKLVAAEKWHFTLRFLGPTSRQARDTIITRLSSASLGSAFKIQFGELGAFPNPRRARVLWLGVTRGGEGLSDLATIAEDASRSAGFVAEGRRFTPHLTLGRIDPPQNISALLAQNHSYPIETTITALILYRSRLGGGPARYEEAARFDLSGASSSGGPR